MSGRPYKFRYAQPHLHHLHQGPRPVGTVYSDYGPVIIHIVVNHDLHTGMVFGSLLRLCMFSCCR